MGVTFIIVQVKTNLFIGGTYLPEKENMNLTSYDAAFLIAAITIITLALIFYSVGVWSERIQRGLRGWHVIVFGLGLACDLVGTTFMAELVRLTGHDNRLHAVTGSIAVFLMGIHAVWAFWTFRKGSAKAKRNFSKFSVFVWCIWLIPYLIGMYLGMSTGF